MIKIKAADPSEVLYAAPRSRVAYSLHGYGVTHPRPAFPRQRHSAPILPAAHDPYRIHASNSVARHGRAVML